jgi:hypothetical protein
VINRRSLYDHSLLQGILFLVLCCSSGLGACRHPPGWFHFNISPLLLHVVPSISVYITLPSVVVSLLQEYEDVLPNDVPNGLPPVRGIEHQIDFVPGATIPNRPTYRSNPKETKELQRQVEELMANGHVRESMSPCAVLVLLVPKEDGT